MTTKPPEDPIVAEVRAAGEKLFRDCGQNLHRFFERLREVERSRERPARLKDPAT